MERAENAESGGCLQRDSTECKEYAGAQSAARPETGTGETEVREPKLLEKILFRDNMNRAYKRVKANKGAPGVDGMTVEEALPWLKEHGKELTENIQSGKYKPQPVRRKEIPKPDGGVRKLGIPAVVDRIVQQAVSQILAPIWEPIFSEGSYGYRPGRSAQDAILKIRGYVFDGYEWAVELDLSKYFDTLNHEKLLNLLRKEVTDERVVQLIKKFLKSGVMENGIKIATEEGSPQGGPLSPGCRTAVGKQHTLSRRKTEAKSEPGKEPSDPDNIPGELQVSRLRIQKVQGGCPDTGTSEILGEGKSKIARADEEKPGQECQAGHGKAEAFHARLAELLWTGGHEVNGRET